MKVSVNCLAIAAASMMSAALAQGQNLFESDGSGNIYELTPSGTRSTFAPGLDEPFGLAFNSAGNLFEADYYSGNIYEFTPSGTRSTFASGLGGPTALAFDNSGNLYEADLRSGNIYEFTPNGGSSTFATGLDGPTALAFQGITLPFPEPVAGFIAAPTNGIAPLAVTFADTSTGSITNRFWSFGDGSTTNFALATNPTHTYGPGNYTVTLVASGPVGVSTNIQPNYIVAIGTNTISTCSSPAAGGTTSGSGTYTNSSPVTVSAIPNPCYDFVDWTVNGTVVSTSTNYTFTITTGEILTANFAVFGGPTNGGLAHLWSFTNGLDGAAPYAPLVQGSDGNFYGTTYGSGTGPSEYGSVFWISPSGYLTNLHSFVGSDGANPSAGLVQGRDGSFYGTTYAGGENSYGTLFRISSAGALTNLWSFTNGIDGGNPGATLIQGSDSNFYGTTTGSGSGASPYGTVFRINPAGALTNLWSFTNGVDGANPFAGLVQADDGNFYGVTYGSGSGASPYGTVFRITPSGSLSNLWSFTNGPDGAYSYAPLIEGNDGNFYGTTSGSGSGPSAYGTVFRVSPVGSLSNLWSFTGCGDGANPYAGLAQGNDGNFYGTTFGSGSGPGAYGTVFKLSAPGICNFSISPTYATFGWAGGSGSIDVAASSASCPWTVTNNIAWISITSGSSDSGSGTVSYTVAANSNTVARTGALTIAGQTFTVTQASGDSVGDGIPDWWRAQYFSGGGTNTNSVSCATCDADGTGQNNLFKYLAGLDPTNPSSFFGIIAVAQQSNDVLVTWSCLGGHSYVLQNTKSTAMIAEYTTNFVDVSPPILVSGLGPTTTNYLDAGAAYAPVVTAPGGTMITTSVVPSTVVCSAANTRGITDSLGQALPIGSLVMLGTFSISESTIQSSFLAGNVSTIMSNFTPYGTPFAIGDGTRQPASWEVSLSAAGFGGQKIYLLAIDMPTLAAANHLGIFTAPSWVFPADGSEIDIDLGDVTDFVIGAPGGPLAVPIVLGGEAYTFTDTARLSVLPGRILFYRVRLAQ